MKNYTYKCTNCNSEYSAEKVEKEFIYLCPKCGKAEKNKPLEGVLTIEYDYEEISKNISREKFLELQPGKFWLYPQLLPLKISKLTPNVLQRLALPTDQYLEYNFNNSKIWLMDETRNSTFSYKDRASSLIALKAMELGIDEIAAASTGNAGSSLAGICARLGLKSHIFVPKNIPDAKRIQIQSFGANIYIVDGDYDNAFDLCLEISDKRKWYNRNTAYNPLTIEGKKSAAFDIFIYTQGEMPDNIFVPVGDGVIISGIFKGLNELLKLGWIKKLPRLIAVQAKGSDALVRYIEQNSFTYKSANTIADSISAGAPRNLFMAAKAVKESNGLAITVTDYEILTAQKELANSFGILSEPSSASVFAAYKNLIADNKISPKENNLLLITGNGLKDISALEKWNEKPNIKSYDDWVKI
jgi:threonine synthase